MELNYDNFFERRSVLITGGAGFIGSHLTQHLARLGADVHVLDNLSTGYRKNIDGIDVSLIEGSILEASALEEAINGCSIVFHEAAFVSVPESFEDADSCFATNIKGTSNVLKAAKRARCDRVVFASSAACYGSSPQLPSSETDTVSAESPYAQSKVMGEQLMKDAQLDAVSLRYFNVFGERQDPTSQYAAVVSSFAHTIQAGKRPVIFGDGTQTRDFTPVENIVHANLLAASHPKPLHGEIFNVGTGVSTSLIELVRAMSGSDRVTFETKRTGDVQDSRADITKISDQLGYETVVQTSDMLRTLVNRTHC